MFRFFLSGRIKSDLMKKTQRAPDASGEEPKSASSFQDIVLLGGVAGAMGLLTRDIYSFFAKLIGLSKFYVWNISAGLFMEQKYVKTFFGNVVGFLSDIVFGALMGIVFIYFLKFTNSKNFLIKAWGFGMAAWLLLFGILFHNLPGSQAMAPKDAISNISAFVGHSIFGISMGIYAQILLKRSNKVEF